MPASNAAYLLPNWFKVTFRKTQVILGILNFAYSNMRCKQDNFL